MSTRSWQIFRKRMIKSAAHVTDQLQTTSIEYSSLARNYEPTPSIFKTSKMFDTPQLNNLVACCIHNPYPRSIVKFKSCPKFPEIGPQFSLNIGICIMWVVLWNCLGIARNTSSSHTLSYTWTITICAHMLGCVCAYDKRMLKHMTWKPKDPPPNFLQRFKIVK